MVPNDGVIISPVEHGEEGPAPALALILRTRVQQVAVEEDGVARTTLGVAMRVHPPTQLDPLGVRARLLADPHVLHSARLVRTR